jgi:hypothetical protein
MRGDSQVRFLGGRVGAIPPGYPTPESVASEQMIVDVVATIGVALQQTRK